jgi:hypothetical protein
VAWPAVKHKRLNSASEINPSIERSASAASFFGQHPGLGISHPCNEQMGAGRPRIVLRCTVPRDHL